MQQFELHDFSGEASLAVVTTLRLKSDSAAKAAAGRLAKRNGGPVDLAFAGGAEWNERYITTAAPSPYHASGYRFERLEG
jgi:hypothetical protein